MIHKDALVPSASTTSRNGAHDSPHSGDNVPDGALSKQISVLCSAQCFSDAEELVCNARQNVSIAGAAEMRHLTASVFLAKGDYFRNLDGTQAAACYERAGRELKLALRAADQCDDVILEARCLHHLAEVHLRIGMLTGDHAMFEMAYAEAATALDFNQRNGFTVELSKNLRLLDRIDRWQG